ncbi:MAG: hypothetical protein BVN34_09090 [Proteobacteria bacterium ST_bin12]|nr:MAG: hypothetical protein BVN34_09090 [Proteobacteria bacterium ST_bin12]
MKPISATVASKNDVLAAIDTLDKLAKQKIVVAAKRILGRHPGLQIHMSVEELIQEGLTLALETRNWDPAKADFPRFISGNMRSFASNESRKNAHTRPNIDYVEDSVELESATASATVQRSLTPPEKLIEDHENATMATKVAILKMTLSEDKEALAILNLLLENQPKREIRKQLCMTEKQYWTADSRLLRAVNKLGENYEKFGKTKS